jgi:hypothetical protein
VVFIVLDLPANRQDLAQALAEAKAHYLEAAEVLRDELQAHYERQAGECPIWLFSISIHTQPCSLSQPPCQPW